MAQPVIFEPAFVLHRRPYSNTSLIVELLTRTYGRVAVLARSARGLKSRYKGKLELFFPLLVSWIGRSDLKTLGAIELKGMPYLLEGNSLLCAFYLNELLIRVLHHYDPYSQLFDYYQAALDQLVSGVPIEQVLRCFEKRLLNELGYGLPLKYEIKTRRPIESDQFYQYYPDQGFLRCEERSEQDIFSGKSLLALEEEDFRDRASLEEMKRLMRLTFSRLLGKKPLKTRELLR